MAVAATTSTAMVMETQSCTSMKLATFSASTTSTSPSLFCQA